MDKLKINLIPPEIKENAKKEAKRAVLVRLSVGLLGLLILFTAGILAVIIFQNVTLQSLQADLETEKANIAGLKDAEVVAFFLKNRIDTINQFSSSRYSQGDTYQLINGLIPSGVNMLSLQIDKNPVVALQGDTESTASLGELFDNLLDPKKNEGKVTTVNVESLSRSQSGKIGFSLQINLKGK